MASPDSPMPGAFVYEHPIPPKLDLAGASSSVFQPPSPMSATSSLCRTIKSNQGGSRKRQRFDRSDGSARTFSKHDSIDSGYSSRKSEHGGIGSLFSCKELTSPAPFVNTDYRFAGGLDGQSASLAAALEIEEYHGQELDYRPNRYRACENFPTEATTLQERGHGRKRARPSSSSSSSPQKGNGWGKTVFNMVGGVAGKVWDFCWTGAFRGFHAGGGMGYQMNTPQRQTDQGIWQTDPGRGDDLFRTHSREGVPIPGQFPRQVEEHSRGIDADDINNSWILVKNEEPESARSSPTTHGPRKHARRISNAARPMTPRKAVATRTGRKSVLTAGGRPSSASQMASHASPKNLSPTKTDNPASAEAQRYAAKARRREREEDASIQRLNQQLKAMIKEGKEALGTKIEVDDDSMDVEDFDY